MLFPRIGEGQTIGITFSAAIDGVPLPIDSIWVKNVTSGGDNMLYAPDTVLLMDITTGFPGTLHTTVPGFSLSQAAPNPFDGSTRFQVNVDDTGDLFLTVHDAVGRLVASTWRTVGQGTHIYSFSGGPQGVLFVAAQWKGQRAVQRILSMNGGQQADLRYTGWEKAPDAGWMKDGWGTWQFGDSLFYIVFSTGPFGYVFSASDGMNLIGPSSQLLDLLPGVVCAEEPFVMDIDNNIYPAVQIGGQCWMAANLRTSRYRNGITIPNLADDPEGSYAETGAWCNYDHNATLDSTHGKLYIWYSVANFDLCPLGWHVPSDAEWMTLEAALGMPPDQLDATGFFRGAAQNVGGRLKSTGTIEAGTGPWTDPNTNATNASGFSGIPGGFFYDLADFYAIDVQGYWWTSTPTGSATAYARELAFTNAGIHRNNGMHMWQGLSVRCIRDQDDCSGVLYGTAYMDNCGTCVGGTTGIAPCTQDCTGEWGGPALPGTPCDDGDAETLDDVYGTDCVCAGQAFDCEGVLGGTALPGTACNDGDPGTTDDVYDDDCICAGLACPATVADIDGNVYPVVQMGEQCWMAENLKTTRYRDGGDIPHVTDGTAWTNPSTAAWCNFDNAEANDDTFGKLYNWSAATDPLICPLGWHVPTEAEWQALESFLGMPAGELGGAGIRGQAQNVGGKLKSTTDHWSEPNEGATNESGFTGLPGGFRDGSMGNFSELGNYGWYWSSSEYNVFYAWARKLTSESSGIERSTPFKRIGISIRCLRD